MISLIVARARGGAIGKNGDIPWRAPEDLKFFQRETMGGAVIMGRRTWDSLPFKPLKNRLNIVVTSQDLNAPVVCGDVDGALHHATEEGHRRIYGIGGEHIYGALIDRADRLLITEVAVDVPGADTFFPDFNPDNWVLVGRHPLQDEPTCVLHEYLRKGPQT
ncbi:dihydrofolate reductase [Oceaniglobus ichthyenteri]|uniref:dihydrofolate reductase n=1 Tax=Oceaniglobus ichthyenteri TaxID=2136177 RepID=UPI000D3C5415|nr:dihydrofolate reductase [Oceaniglobus ichthyenteri]